MQHVVFDEFVVGYRQNVQVKGRTFISDVRGVRIQLFLDLSALNSLSSASVQCGSYSAPRKFRRRFGSNIFPVAVSMAADIESDMKA